MAGAPAATLQGWWILSVVGEHTYVTSSCGLTWRCFGRDSGGTGLAAGTGSSVIADCLSQPNSTAGISYLKTGVCHQAANRILHPAGVTVAGCQTFGVSQMIFGVYGKGAWPELSNCYPPGASVAQVRSAKPMSKARNLSERVGVYNSMVSSMVSTNHNTGVSAEAVELDELSALVEMGLGHPLDPPTLNALFVIQTALRKDQSGLVTRLDAGELTSHQYVDQLTLILQSAMAESQKLLGDERFRLIFGEAGRHPESIIDRDRFVGLNRFRPLKP